MIEGRRYLERGEPVIVLIQWGPGGGPRNVLIERADGSKVVRPFRGLRRDRAAEIAEAVLEDKSASPELVLACWHYLYGWKRDWLPMLLGVADAERRAA